MKHFGDFSVDIVFLIIKSEKISSFFYAVMELLSSEVNHAGRKKSLIFVLLLFYFAFANIVVKKSHRFPDVQ